MKPPVLRCRNVAKRYGKFVALEDLSLEVYEGEIFALLGPNGAGKSTLIHCITGLARQSEGSIEVLGFDTVGDFRTTRRLVGLVPQEINYDPFFTPLESLMIQMGLMGVKPNRERAESLLKTFALDEKRDAYTRTLSGGMKRRLLVAKALVHAPRLLFLDEPTAGRTTSRKQSGWPIGSVFCTRASSSSWKAVKASSNGTPAARSKRSTWSSFEKPTGDKRREHHRAQNAVHQGGQAV